ncbi:eukaryotic translation initiation factor 2 subunit beta-like [Selaginella moellendorffii]|uniref:eukaryotic translation initiation factor 2 subunit beta-like n=1 Tax=Selaginella moellendorffii TaxID=88036 RepID=UPI000D1C48D0|nr:eukaryotic translation initiation factor 2 subunit beta-like [Selaginella moellendorffii]|eukprot:XP_024537698.1 eukaryotic translation initiation factor 2 subunit beta-like [Selaginella moellendorffii]
MADDDSKDIATEIGPFDPTKKKKKKKVRMAEDEDGDGVEKLTEKVESLSMSVSSSVDNSAETVFAGKKKKKKKKPVEADVAEEENLDAAETNGLEEGKDKDLLGQVENGMRPHAIQ